MKTKIFIILLTLICFGTGGFFVYKNLEVSNNQAKIEISSEESEFKFEWKMDSGERVADGGIPFVYKLTDGKYRLYYCGEGGILSAISSDGLNFKQEEGVRISPDSDFGKPESTVCDATIVSLPDGGIRMYYKGATSPGDPGEAIHNIFSAVSDDGLNFKKEGLRIDSTKTNDNGWASVPEAIKLSDGRVRIYYVSGDSEAEGGIMSAISEDGLNFQKEAGVRVKGGYTDPAITILPNGKFLLLVTYNCKPEKGWCDPKFINGIYSLVSDNGLNFSNLELVMEANLGYFFLDPAIIEIEKNVYRVYFGVLNSSGPEEHMIIKSMTGYLK